MSTQRKLLLMVSSICYLLVLYGILFTNFKILLIFFILFSVCILSFAIMSMKANDTDIELDILRAEHEELIKSTNDKINELNRQRQSSITKVVQYMQKAHLAMAWEYMSGCLLFSHKITIRS